MTNVPIASGSQPDCAPSRKSNITNAISPQIAAPTGSRVSSSSRDERTGRLPARSIDPQSMQVETDSAYSWKHFGQ